MADGIVLGDHTPTADGVAPRGGRVDLPNSAQTLERARAAIRASLDARARSIAALGYAAAVAVAADAARAREQSAGERAERAELRGAVGDYARRLRADGVPPQGMLVRVKAALRESTPPGVGALEARESLTPDVVRWSVEAYYDAV